MKIIPYEAAHIARLEHQKAEVLGVSYVTPEYTQRLVAAGPAYSALHDGRILACCGLADSGFGMGVLWAFIAANTRTHFISLDRAARRFIESSGFRRIEASTPEHFKPGCRWLSLLGFENEGLMRQFTPDGMNHWRYARLL